MYAHVVFIFARLLVKKPWFFSVGQSKSDGGFKHFLVSPLPGEMIQFDLYFSDGLVQPPTRNSRRLNLQFPFGSWVPEM